MAKITVPLHITLPLSIKNKRNPTTFSIDEIEGRLSNGLINAAENNIFSYQGLEHFRESFIKKTHQNNLPPALKNPSIHLQLKATTTTELYLMQIILWLIYALTPLIKITYLVLSAIFIG